MSVGVVEAKKPLVSNSDDRQSENQKRPDQPVDSADNSGQASNQLSSLSSLVLGQFAVPMPFLGGLLGGLAGSLFNKQRDYSGDIRQLNEGMTNVQFAVDSINVNLNGVKSGIDGLRVDIGGVRTDLKSTKREMLQQLRNQTVTIRGDIEKARESLTKDIDGVKVDTEEIKDNTFAIMGGVHQSLMALNRNFDGTLRNTEMLGRNYEALSRNYEGIVRNYDDLQRNYEAMNRNYDATLTLERRLNETHSITVDHLLRIDTKVDIALDLIERSKVEILENIHLAKEELLDSIRSIDHEKVVTGLETFFAYFYKEVADLASLPVQEQIVMLQGNEELLNFLKRARMPTNANSLFSLLQQIITRKLAIPKKREDKYAPVMLKLLCNGVEANALIMIFLVEKYALLADHYYQLSDLDKFNQYLAEVVNSFTNYGATLDGLIPKVKETLKEVLKVESAKEDQDLATFAAIKSEQLKHLKEGLKQFGKQLQLMEPKALAKPDFSMTPISSFFGEWSPGKVVRYAVQHLDPKTGLYTKVSRWSPKWTIAKLANPRLVVPVDAANRTRILFRQMNGETPKRIGILRDSKETAFTDVHRDLFEAAHDANEAVNLEAIHFYLQKGADVNMSFEGGQTALHGAVLSGNLAIVKLLLENGANVETKDSQGFAPLHIAAQEGKSSILLALLENKADINYPNALGSTALHIAAMSGQLAIVNLLLDFAHIQVNNKNGKGYTALHGAAANGHLEIVERLLKVKQIFVEAKTSEKFTALHLAAMFNHEAIVQLLIHSGRFNINAKGDNDLTGLHLAAMHNSLEVLKVLLQEPSVEVNGQMSNHFTALHLAIKFKHEEAALELLSSPTIDVNAQGEKDHVTPLHMASVMGAHSVAAHLLAKGARVDLLAAEDFSALHYAIAHARIDIATALTNASPTLLSWLTDSGSSWRHFAAYSGNTELITLGSTSDVPVDIKDVLDTTPLYIAYKYDNVQIGELFLESQANARLRLSNYQNFLHMAAKNGHPNAVENFLKYNLAINATDSEENQPLHFATKNGHIEIVRLLLEKGANPNASDKENMTPLHHALMLGHQKTALVIAKLLLGKQANLNAKNKVGQSVLYLACKKGNLTLVNFLLNENVEVNSGINGEKASPLHAAAEENHHRIARKLIEKGAAITARDEKGQTVLHAAIRGKGDLEMIKLLTAARADLNAVDSTSVYPIDAAIKAEKVTIVEYLAERQAQRLSGTAENRWTLLHYAAQEASRSFVDLLLRKGHRLTDKNTLGETALMLSIRGKGDEIFVKYLIEKGARVNEKDSSGMTPMMEAALAGKREVAELLASHGASITVANRSGSTALHGAAGKGHLSFVKWLLTRSADVRARDGHSRTALFAAVSGKGDLEMVRLLTEAGSEWNVTDAQGRTLVAEAAAQNKDNVLEYLAENGVSYNQTDNEGLTPLHFAAKNGNLKMIAYLLDKGVFVDPRDKERRTPLQLAIREKGGLEVVKLLVDNDAYIRTKDRHGVSLVDEAVLQGKTDIANFLSSNADLKSLKKDGWTLLHYAAQDGNQYLVEKLVAKGESIEVMNGAGQTPLQVAIQGKGDLSMVQFFLRKGAKIETTDNEGNTLLHEAVLANKIEIGRFLVVDKRIALETKNGANLAAIYFAVKEGHLAFVMLLARRLANIFTQTYNEQLLVEIAIEYNQPEILEFFVNYRDSTDWSMLHKAALLGNLPVVQALLEKGAKINQVTAEKWSPLHLAAQNGYLEIVRYLVTDRCAQRDLQNQEGKTATELAQGNGHSDVVKFLKANDGLIEAITSGNVATVEESLSQGIALKCVDANGWTALHYAAKNNQLAIVKLLIKHGVKTSIAAPDGKKAIHLATENGWVEVEKYLTETTARLGAAIEEGSLGKVKQAIEVGADLSNSDSQGWSALHHAASKGHTTIVQMLLEAGASLFDRTSIGETALDLASKGSHAQVEKFLMERAQTQLWAAIQENSLTTVELFASFWDISKVTDSRGWTALHLAAYHDRRDIAKFLLSKGAHTRALTTDGQLPLDVAIRNEKKDMVTFLVNTSNGQGLTMLHRAAADSQLSIVEKLLNVKAKVNIKAKNGESVLQVAVKRGGDLETVSQLLTSGASLTEAPEIVQTAIKAGKGDIAVKLIESGALLNTTSAGGNTALHETTKRNDFALVKLLLAKKAAIDAQNEEGASPLHQAVKSNVSLEMIILYVANGADTGTTDKEGNGLLHSVAEKGRLDILEYLLSEGVTNMTAKNKEGNTALHLAAMAGHLELVQLLVKKGANFNAKNAEQMTPLEEAAVQEKTDVVAYLATVKDTRGWTMLHDAASKGEMVLIRLLLQKGASIGEPNGEQMTALHLAILGGHEETIEYFIDKGAMLCTGEAESYGNSQLWEAMTLLRLSHVQRIIDNIQHSLALGQSLGPGKKTTLGVLKGNAKCMDSRGNTLLHHAASMGKVDAATVLIQEGTSLTVLNDRQQTALDVAIEKDLKMEFEKQTEEKEREERRKADKAEVDTLVNELIPLAIDEENMNSSDKRIIKAIGIILPRVLPGVDLAGKDESKYFTEKKKQLLHVMEYLVNAVDRSGYSLLHYAAEQGDLAKVQLLLEKGASVRLANGSKVQPLHLASASGQLAVVETLLASGASSCEMDVNGETALTAAIKKNGSVDIVRLLVSKGASCLKSTDKSKGTLLHAAVLAGKGEIAKFLIDNGVLLDAVNENAQTALHLAAGKGDASMIELLLASPASVTLKDSKGRTALFSAISEQDNVQLVGRLVERGSDIHVVDKENVHLLAEAVIKEKTPLVEYLLNHEFDVTRTSGSEGSTALHEAAKRCNLPLIKILQQKGGQVSARDKLGNTVLHVALEKSCPMGVVDYLLSFGADLKVTNNQNSTVLHLAAQQESFVALESLLSKLDSGLKIDAKNSAGRTPLQVWISQGGGGGADVGGVSIDSLNMFISKGANLNVKDSDEGNLVMEAARRNSTLLVNFLVNERGIEPNGANRHGWTALHEASKVGNVAMMNLFLQKQASLEKTNEHGWTALHVASSVGQLEAVKFLVEHGANVDALSLKNETALYLAVNKKQYEVVRYYVTLTEEAKAKVIAKRSAAIRIRRQASRQGIYPSAEPSTMVRSSAARPGALLNSAASSLAFSVKFVTNWFHTKVQEIPIKSDNEGVQPSGFSYLQSLPIDGTLLLFDLLARQFTRQKYVSTTGHQISSREARGTALHIASQFEGKLQDLAKERKLELSFFDSFNLFQTIEKILLSEQSDKIDGILLAVAKEALPVVDERFLKGEIKKHMKEQLSEQ